MRSNRKPVPRIEINSSVNIEKEQCTDKTKTGEKPAASPHYTSTRAASRGPSRLGSDSAGDSAYSPRVRSTSSTQSLRRKRPAPVEAESDEDEGSTTQDSPATCTSANHNKYCHFCQHVKVRASSMLACENPECCRRFCEHCLLTHLNEDVDPMSSDAWSMSDGKAIWHCPICRKKCCCSVSNCEENHRHCKAYRYRRRRAELATKRMTAAANHSAAEKRSKKGSSSKASTPRSSAHSTPTMTRPTLDIKFPRAQDGRAANSSIDSPPIRSVPAVMPLPAMERPRREAAMRRRNYALGDDDDDQDEELHGKEHAEITTPGDEECHVAHSHHHHGPESGGSKKASQQQQQPAEAASSSEQTSAHTHAHAHGANHEGSNEPHTILVESHDWADQHHGNHTSSHLHLQLPSDLHYRSDADPDDETEHLMLGGIYGHMSHFAADRGTAVCGDACEEMLLDEEHLGSTELDEARWLRKTYETVYNPTARLRALQALTGADAKAKTNSETYGAGDAMWKKQMFSPATAAHESELSYFISHGAAPQKAMWSSSEGQQQQQAVASRKCTVMYDYV